MRMRLALVLGFAALVLLLAALAAWTHSHNDWAQPVQSAGTAGAVLFAAISAYAASRAAAQSAETARQARLAVALHRPPQLWLNFQGEAEAPVRVSGDGLVFEESSRITLIWRPRGGSERQVRLERVGQEVELVSLAWDMDGLMRAEALELEVTAGGFAWRAIAPGGLQPGDDSTQPWVFGRGRTPVSLELVSD